MNREQYLRTRIAEISEQLKKRHLPPLFRENQEQALKFCLDDLRKNKNGD